MHRDQYQLPCNLPRDDSGLLDQTLLDEVLVIYWVSVLFWLLLDTRSIEYGQAVPTPVIVSKNCKDSASM
jgi:hypothetical protein